jgi:hypothetical protein
VGEVVFVEDILVFIIVFDAVKFVEGIEVVIVGEGGSSRDVGCKHMVW